MIIEAGVISRIHICDIAAYLEFFKTPQGHIGQIILDANWNASPEMYTFVYYKHPTEPIPFNDPAFQVGPRYRHPITVHMKGMRIADKIALNVVAQGTAASMRSMELRVQDYCDANSIATGNFNKANQKANELCQRICAEVVDKLMLEIQNANPLGRGGQRGGSAGRYDDVPEPPLMFPPHPPPRGPPGPQPPYFGPDGNLMGPNDPTFRGAGQPPLFDRPPHANPFGRFDPIGPFGNEPDPDHMRPPRMGGRGPPRL
eukprot:GHVU01042319.1.p1 GENE.GHVU01042319.1~~GHVU01042319.1.p1  ORF type:complete len:258 (+),score=21.00 GHVU01042319.1:373-1146(+)